MENVVARIGELLGELQSPDFFVREAAVKELGQFQEDEAVAGLVMALEDADLGIRELAAGQLSQIRSGTAAQLLIRFLAHVDIGTRNLASEILVKIGHDAVAYLIENLNDPDHDVRKFIADVLGLIGDDAAVDGLCQALWDCHLNVNCSAAEALGEVGSPRAVPHLIAAASQIEDARPSAIEALGKIGDPEALSHLYKHLSDPDPVVQFAAIEAIGKVGRSDSVPRLVQFLKSSEQPLAESAMTAIIRICVKHGGQINYDIPLQKFTDYLFESIKNRDAEVTEFTLSRLGRWYGNDVVRKLLDVIEYFDDARFRQVMGILAEIGEPAGFLIVERLATAPASLKLKLLEILRMITTDEVVLRLLPFVDDEDAEVRIKVAQILGCSSASGSLPALKKLALDGNGHVRGAAYSALGWLAQESDVDFIFAGLDDQYADVREAAVGALVIVGGPRVVAKFTADLYHENPERQRLAVTALGWIGESEVVEPLLRAVNHPEPQVRKSAIASLARIGIVPNTEPIVMALNDEDSAVRKAAVSALVAIEGKNAVDRIKFLLNDDDVWVRYHTIAIIGDLRDRAYAEYLRPHLDAEMDIIKIAAAKALSLLGDDQAIQTLRILRNHKNKDLAEAAAFALQRIGGPI